MIYLCMLSCKVYFENIFYIHWCTVFVLFPMNNVKNNVYVKKHFWLVNQKKNMQVTFLPGQYTLAGTLFTSEWRVRFWLFQLKRASWFFRGQHAFSVLICSSSKTSSHTFKSVIFPTNGSVKSPPKESWSCPTMKIPLPWISRVVSVRVPVSFITPSTFIIQSPSLFLQLTHTWCHSPSFGKDALYGQWWPWTISARSTWRSAPSARPRSWNSLMKTGAA